MEIRVIDTENVRDIVGTGNTSVGQKRAVLKTATKLQMNSKAHVAVVHDVPAGVYRSIETDGLLYEVYGSKSGIATMSVRATCDVTRDIDLVELPSSAVLSPADNVLYDATRSCSSQPKNKNYRYQYKSRKPQTTAVSRKKGAAVRKTPTPSVPKSKHASIKKTPSTGRRRRGFFSSRTSQ